MKVNQRESLSRVISYYGNHLSFDQIVSLANKEVVNKYSYAEQKYGLALLKKIETGTLTDEDRQIISNDYRKQEVFDTIENEETRKLFLYEVTNNGLIDSEKPVNFDKRYQYSENIFSNLAKNINLFEGLIHAQRDNLMRENEEQKHRRKAKIRKKKQKSKQANKQRGL